MLDAACAVLNACIINELVNTWALRISVEGKIISSLNNPASITPGAVAHLRSSVWSPINCISTYALVTVAIGSASWCSDIEKSSRTAAWALLSCSAALDIGHTAAVWGVWSLTAKAEELTTALNCARTVGEIRVAVTNWGELISSSALSFGESLNSLSTNHAAPALQLVLSIVEASTLV